MGKEIDWTKAPEGATHWDTEGKAFCADGVWWSTCGGFKGDYNAEWGTDRYIPRPKTLSIKFNCRVVLEVETERKSFTHVRVNGKLYEPVSDGEC